VTLSGFLVYETLAKFNFIRPGISTSFFGSVDVVFGDGCFGDLGNYRAMALFSAEFEL